MRLAFVLPRFGPGVVGGAELLGWRLAERLAKEHEVEILTTCALDHFTWVNQLPPGAEMHGDVKVHRFLVDPRDIGIHSELERAIVSGFRLTSQEEIEWLRSGVASTGMEQYLESNSSSYDLIVALPYLFGTTYFTYAAAKDKVVIIPCLHDEPYARLSVVKEMLQGARGLMFNSPPEATLAQSLAGHLAPHTHVGMGFDVFPDDPPLERFKKRSGLKNPFVLYAGRREGGKNTPLLITYFTRYRERKSVDLDLVFVGSGDPIPDRPGIVEIRDFDWNDAAALYGAATIFCQPSVNESFSIVMMQSWLAGTPVMVHGKCAVTRYHCERSNGGLWFDNYAEFEEVLDRLLASPALRSGLGNAGRHYVGKNYSWNAVLSRFNQAAENWLRTEEPQTVH